MPEEARSTGSVEDGEVAEDAGRFGGTRTPAPEDVRPDSGWDADAQDEDALMSESGGRDGLAPVADATPHGDVAGVGQPEVVAALDAAAEAGAGEEG